MSEILFEAFPKIGRWKRNIVITEKIDGTNAQVYVPEDSAEPLRFGSRNRWITPEDDNHGFARWATEHAAELRELGPGRHFGEWYGKGIQRSYGLDEKRFALFNSGRWSNDRPACCHVVPVLYAGMMSEVEIDQAMYDLRVDGSVAVPGFRRPEGIVVFHCATGMLFKRTLDTDEAPKGIQS